MRYYYSITSYIQILLLCFLSNVSKAQLFSNLTGDVISNETGRRYVSCSFVDINNDNYPDVSVISSDFGQAYNRIYINNGDGTFTSQNNTITSKISASQAAAWVDYDNDNDLDFYVTNAGTAYSNDLFRNDGGGVFTEITGIDIADVTSSFSNNLFESHWADLNTDNLLDLIVGTDNTGALNRKRYHNTGGGVFNEITSTSVNNSMPIISYSITSSDYDKDGDIDLLIIGTNTSSTTAVSTWYTNDGAGNYTTSNNTSIAGGIHYGASWGDYDNDQDMDFYLSQNNGSGTATGLLFRNNGNGSFVSLPSAATGINAVGYGRGSAWIDYDNDRDLDLVVLNDRNSDTEKDNIYLYQNNGNGTFTQITDGGVAGDIISTARNWRSCAVADYDVDGDLDIIATSIEDGNIIFKNNNNNGNRWLKIKLQGVISNKFGIGAKVYVRTASTNWQMKELTHNSGYGGQSDYLLHFGVGNSTTADSIRVEWPSGIVQRYASINTNQLLTITEVNPNISVANETINDGDVFVNTDKRAIHSFRVRSNNVSDALLKDLTVNMRGSYFAADLKNNSIKIWHSETNNLNTAVLVGAYTTIDNGSSFTASNINRRCIAGKDNYFWVTVDVATNPPATIGRQIRIEITNTDLVFRNGSINSGSINMQGTQTIRDIPDVDISTTTVNAGNIPQSSTNNILQAFQITVSNFQTNLTALTVRTDQTYVVGDFVANSFKLWYNTTNNFSTANVVDSRAIVATGSNINFTSFTRSVSVGSNNFFWVTVDVAGAATIGNTIQILNFTGSGAFTFSTIDQITLNTNDNGGIQTITEAIPNIALNSVAIAAADVLRGTDVIVYKHTAAVTLNNTTLTEASYTTGGTYNVNDITDFKLYTNTSDNLGTATLLQTQPPVASSGTLTFSGLSSTTNSGQTRYYWVVASVKNTAQLDNTISVTTNATNHTFSTGNKSGTVTIAGLQRFVDNSNMLINSLAIADATVVQGTTSHILYRLQMTASGYPATLNSIQYTTQGTYAVSDLVSNRFRLWVNTTDNFSTASQIGTNQAIVSSGSNITFSSLNYALNNGANLYFWLTVDVSEFATIGRNISIVAPSVGWNNIDISAPFVVKTGTPTVGGVQTFEELLPDITISAPTVAAANVNVGTPKHILYRWQIAVSKRNTQLQSIAFTTNGTYVLSDLVNTGFRLWYNSSDNFSTATLVASRNLQNTGSTLNFTSLNRNMNAGTNHYYWLTVDIDSLATINNTIAITSTLNDLIFNKGNKIGAIGTAGTQTIIGIPTFLGESTSMSHEVLLPTLFSPNGDGSNDAFILRSRNVAEINMRIYDRFGALVYTNNNVNELTSSGWNGSNQPSGIYVWSADIIFEDGVKISTKGEVKLVK
ncbi:MAG: hypothetical protein EAZ55_06935 [Cytophagales bacterium]|nr:MAG: hypothetical protein EAZ55_06935 [Cytophagales bacterium]